MKMKDYDPIVDLEGYVDDDLLKSFRRDTQEIRVVVDVCEAIQRSKGKYMVSEESLKLVKLFSPNSLEVRVSDNLGTVKLNENFGYLSYDSETHYLGELSKVSEHVEQAVKYFLQEVKILEITKKEVDELKQAYGISKENLKRARILLSNPIKIDMPDNLGTIELKTDLNPSYKRAEKPYSGTVEEMNVHFKKAAEQLVEAVAVSNMLYEEMEGVLGDKGSKETYIQKYRRLTGKCLLVNPIRKIKQELLTYKIDNQTNVTK